MQITKVFDYRIIQVSRKVKNTTIYPGEPSSPVCKAHRPLRSCFRGLLMSYSHSL